MGSGELEIRVTFDQLFRSVALKADGEFAIFALAFDIDDGSNAVFRVTDARADERIGGRARRYRSSR